MTLSWVDGQPAEGLPVHDRALANGDGLFETIKVVGGQPELLDRHLQRLASGCQRLAIPCDIDLVSSYLSAFCAELGRGVARISGEVEVRVANHVLGKERKGDELIIYRPEVAVLRSRLPTTTQYLFSW